MPVFYKLNFIVQLIFFLLSTVESAESAFAAVRIVLLSDDTVGSVEAGFGVSEIFPVKAGAISTDFFILQAHRFYTNSNKRNHQHGH